MISDRLITIIWDVSPKIFTLDFFGLTLPITWYGVFFAMGFLVGQQVFRYIFRHDEKPASDVEILTIYVAIATVTSARLGHFIFYEWELLLSHPWQWFVLMVLPPFSGLASHGATIGILLALYVYSRKKPDQSFLWLADRIVIPGSLSGALIRLGNLMNSEIYGKPTNLPWGFLFTRETDPSLLPLVPRHPTQLYEAFFCVGLLIYTFYLWKYKRHTLPKGFITGVFLILLFSFRFLVEFLKNDQADFEAHFYLNMGQILSIPAILLGIAVLYIAKRDFVWKMRHFC